MAADAQRLHGALDAQLVAIGGALQTGLVALAAGVDWLLAHSAAQPAQAAAGAVPFLKLSGTVIGGWLLARGAEAAHALLGGAGNDTHPDADFWSAKLHTTRHYMAHVMVDAAALSQTVTDGAETTLSLADHQF